MTAGGGTSTAPLVALIPAYRPDRALVDVVEALAESGTFAGVVIVDDGSGPEFRPVFAAVGRIDGVMVLRHAVNLGKGAALKTAINHALVTHPDLVGVVTADADGQHRPADVRRVGERLRQNPNTLVLGSRRFAGDVPLRSRFGNELTKFVFRALIGHRLGDTQTGLRGIPASLLPHLLSVRSSRYEFEMDMLIVAAHAQIAFLEEPIETIYLDGNRGSHFNPLLDSLRIYFCLLRYTLSSLITYMVDVSVFFVGYVEFRNLLFAHVLARLAAMAINFALVRGFVFRSRDAIPWQASKYLAVVVLSGAVSYAAQLSLVELAAMNPLLAKAAVESVLFFANFLVLRDLVFRNAVR
jgi:glycosyltransferase involved in cell wall biosynthesis